MTDISFPALGPDQRGVYLKLGLRQAQAISVVHLAVVCTFDGGSDGPVTDARMALGSVAPTVIRSAEAEAALRGRPLDAATIDACVLAAQESVHPIGDLRAGAEYRTELLGVMVKRALSALRRGEERQAYPGRVATLGGPVVRGATTSGELTTGDSVEAEVNQQTLNAPWIDGTLLDWIREPAGLTGTKEGCAEGECGACTVFLDGTAVLSCLVPSGRAHGATVVTIEGLAPQDDLHPLQQAFIDNAAVQCGYCIPGFLMAGAALQAEQQDRPQLATDTDDDRSRLAELRLGLQGNLCRCTGYYKIIEAFE